ncbi:tRNA (guanosine(37)-N1)-methyltransferase TrmD [Candidatus Chromulinivorax destructor]|uniref:tRNA (guanine-N(1)-)-methyltransferase n=1 Tax=Candidatus Chromulinivorax destructor TaxID=2066483 RepID=A0A345ZB19_9BACT|nr:tRNA (guanosine(37)-N1)-methyltransferase TrmD [Candidatus Chromulinivorax destructor]AXK60486.1 tRNA (guanosine(37)-N1)-methyltransferase TrmD [Candidatus Chromulinivorax destructor]
MNISVLTLFPELYKPFFDASLIKKAQEKGLVSCHTNNLLSYAPPKSRVDDTTFGHNAGMLIKPEIIDQAVTAGETALGTAYKIILSPQGKVMTQPRLQELYERIKDQKHIMLIASRYEGLDARVESHYADELVSVGNFVVMGGDIPAMLLIEGLLRFVPGIVGKEESVQLDSFSGAFVDYPEYTRPIVWKGVTVPEIIRSGNHAAIESWRQEQAAQLTVKKHFNWLRSVSTTQAERTLVKKYIPHHYVALMHNDMMLKEGRIGPTSVTSIDIHDIARSSTTYGLKNFFVVTNLKDQQKMVQKMLSFWVDEKIGGDYNNKRHHAVLSVRLENELDDVIMAIEKKEGKKPLIIGTSARQQDAQQAITYFDQEIVWQHDRPVLFLFGTGSGMSEKLLQRCDYMLPPLQSYYDFNHLSVRSAVAIILDKWLGVALQK